MFSCNRKYEEPSSRRSNYRMDTPDIKRSDIRTPSRSSWDEDITNTPSRTSAWDVMTPSHTSQDEVSSSSRRQYKETPLPTPTFRYNEWANERKSFGVKKKKTGIS